MPEAKVVKVGPDLGWLHLYKTLWEYISDFQFKPCFHGGLTSANLEHVGEWSFTSYGIIILTYCDVNFDFIWIVLRSALGLQNDNMDL